MACNGKIARLPRWLRRKLNTRIDDGEPGKLLVEWLNGLPQVQEMLNEQFEGRPITQQNLSEWRQRGYKAWQLQQEACEFAREISEQSEAISQQADGIPLADQLSSLATLAVARMIKSATAGNLDSAKQRREVCMIIETLSLLRNGDHTSRRLQMEMSAIEYSRERQERKETQNELQRKKHQPLRDFLSAVYRETLVSDLLKKVPLELENEIRQVVGMPTKKSKSEPFDQIRPNPNKSE